MLVNDPLINDFDSDDPGRHIGRDRVGLQNHGEDDGVYFRDLRATELDAEPATR